MTLSERQKTWYEKDMEDTFTQIAELVGLKNQDAEELIATVERLTARVAELEKDAERQNKLMFLASHDVAFFGGFLYNPDERSFVVPRPLILCNDFFAPAADCEEFEPSDIDEIFSIYEKWGDPGVLAWVSLKRGGENPWRLKPTYKFHDDFLKARAAIDAARRTE